jgi:alanine racemase
VTISYRNTIAEVDVESFISNVRSLIALNARDQFFCPMIKANAYGHGAARLLPFLRKEGVANVGVCLLEEALELRKSGDQGSVLMFGLSGAREAAELVHEKITPVVSDWAQLSAIENEVSKRNLKNPFPVHIKFNTGMNRLGFGVSEAEVLSSKLKAISSLRVAGVCTHFTNGSDIGDLEGFSSRQLREFNRVKSYFTDGDIHWHALNSSALVSLKSDPGTLVVNSVGLGARPGIALYDADVLDSANKSSAEIQLKPVMRLKTEIGQLKKIKSGEFISYGGRYQAKNDMTVAILPVGYADGVARTLSNVGKVLFRGKRADIVGTVCMDYIMVDLTSILAASHEATLGEEVVLMGQQGQDSISASEIGRWSQTISYEVFTSVGNRVPRVYIEEKK